MSGAAALPGGLFFNLVSTEEVDAVHELEVQGFPPEEAATLEKLRYVYHAIMDLSPCLMHSWHTCSFRQANAPDLFLGAFVPQIGGKRALLGYVDGVLSSETTLTSNSMSTHVPGARTVLVHGVCVTPDARRRGIASALLAEYQRRLATAGSYDRALLIAHEDKLAFYERMGFKSRGLSSISFAGIPWIELEWIVPFAKPSELQDNPQSIPSGLLEGLRGHGVSPRRKGQLLSSFQDGIHDVSEKGDQTSNRYDLLCVNERCGSIILRRGVAVLLERETVQMEPAGIFHPDLPSLPLPPDKTHWWLVTPSPMSFENIGFSMPTHTDKPLKLLACAECDLGPVGWCEPGGNEFWVACRRVRYKT
ncbi:acyl-CoA N-acyltransferase [Russula dissimulans]|nr:acyl-CoA N-acyltransferase [Russula dissimulans]